MVLILAGNSKMEGEKYRPEKVEETAKVGTTYVMTKLHLAAILAH